ncbi:MAG: hypothetical protein LBC62_00495 [Treponema sp.]|nr:hypothetical protein [Treponema sp.]
MSGGTVTATGGNATYCGAGIGGGGGGSSGHGGAGGTFVISGGMVTAIGPASSSSGYASAGIGGGNGHETGARGTMTTLSGNAVVFASSIAPTITDGSNATQAIVFNGNGGTMYGDVTLQQDVTIPSGKTLNLSSGQTLTIPEEVALTNNGTIRKNGGTISGTVSGNQPQ